MSTNYGGGDISNVNALLLVGRSFQYVTRKGERKNYVIRSYLPWNGSHRVQRLTDNFDAPEEKTNSRKYKTKLIELSVLPNIRWLDDAIDHADMDENCGSNISNNEDGFAPPAKDSGPAKLISRSTRVTKYMGQIPIDDRKRKREDLRSVSPLPKKLPKVMRMTDQEEEEEISPTNAPTRIDILQCKDDNDSSLKHSSIPVFIDPEPFPQRKQHRKKPMRKEAHASTKQYDEELPASPIQKGFNRRTKKKFMSIYTGVWKRNRVGSPWVAQCGRKKYIEMTGGKTIGQYDTEVEAARAYDNALRKCVPSESLDKLNFPTPSERLQLAKIKEAELPETKLQISSTPTKASFSKRDIPPMINTTKALSPTSSTSLTDSHPPAAGDRVASRVGDESSLHLGTLVERDSTGSFDSTSTNKAWTVSFDNGKTEKIHGNEVTDGMKLYETLLDKEDAYPIPKEGCCPEVGDRTAIDFGSSGIQFGFIHGIVEDSDDSDSDGEEPDKAWTVAFDDGDDLELESAEIQKGLELYREIRRKRSIKSLVNSSQCTSSLSVNQQSHHMDVAKSAAEGASITTERLRNVKPGDRIAHDFGDAGVFFGSVDKSHGYESGSEKDCSWDIAFDDGDRYSFDVTEVSQAIALYDQIRENERTDPNTKKKIHEWRDEHLAEKRDVLAKLPQHNKDRFLEVGFAKWGKSHLPCLFLGPYDVSPGTVREEWLEAFSRVSKKSRKFPQIVYWFGTKNLDKGFSILDDSDCLSLKEARAKGLLKHKITQSKAALKHNHALHKLREAIAKPRDHSRLPLQVCEAHERIASGHRLLAEFEAAKNLRTAVDQWV